MNVENKLLKRKGKNVIQDCWIRFFSPEKIYLFTLRNICPYRLETTSFSLSRGTNKPLKTSTNNN